MALRGTKIFFVLGFRFWGRIYSLLFKSCGKRLLLQKPLYITPRFIRCGNCVTIYKNARIEGVERYNNQKFSPIIEIEDGVSVQQNVHITCAHSIIIRKNTAIAANVSITDITHPYEDILIPIERQDIIAGAVEIGEECKIYNNAVILPNVKIGRHCVVGANSVVLAGVYPDYSVMAGSPAKIIKAYNQDTKTWEKIV